LDIKLVAFLKKQDEGFRIAEIAWLYKKKDTATTEKFIPCFLENEWAANDLREVFLEQKITTSTELVRHFEKAKDDYVKALPLLDLAAGIIPGMNLPTYLMP